jgi:hypothetical protein
MTFSGDEWKEVLPIMKKQREAKRRQSKWLWIN